MRNDENIFNTAKDYSAITSLSLTSNTENVNGRNELQNKVCNRIYINFTKGILSVVTYSNQHKLSNHVFLLEIRMKVVMLQPR